MGIPGKSWFSKRLESARTWLLSKRWGQLAVNIGNELRVNNAADIAGGIAYYAILSLFPLLLGIIALLGLFLPSEVVQRELFDFFQRNLPASVDAIRQNVAGIIELRGELGVLSVLGLFWSGSGIFGAISRAVNNAWNMEPRPFFKRKLRDFILALGTSLLFVLSLGSAAASLLLQTVENPLLRALAVPLGPLLAFIFIFTMFLLTYKFFPNCTVTWRDAWPGALLAAVLFELARNLFVFYISRYVDFTLIYGSVSSIIFFLVWVYFSAFILILGAEFSSEYAKIRRPGEMPKCRT